MSDNKPYVENEDFVPEPTAQYGTLDTSGTAGSAHSKVEEVTPVFAVADQQNAVQAAKALDPDDDSVPASLVILPDSDRSREDAEEAVLAKAEKAKDTKVALLEDRVTPAQKEAAESGDEAEKKAEAQTADHGASGGLDGSGTGTTTPADSSKTDSSKTDSSKTEARKTTSSSPSSR